MLLILAEKGGRNAKEARLPSSRGFRGMKKQKTSPLPYIPPEKLARIMQGFRNAAKAKIYRKLHEKQVLPKMKPGE